MQEPNNCEECYNRNRIIMEWQEILIGKESWPFLGEIALRTFIMLVLLFLGLRMTGKRAIKQLSVFDLLLIIALGTTAGDPMIYKEVGIVSSLMAFIVVFGGYRVITYIITRSKGAEKVLEGVPIYIIHEGKATELSLNYNELAMDEFFAELRNKKIFHLGQIESAIFETSGEISLLLYDKKRVKPGLPIWPHKLRENFEVIPEKGLYACTYCGHTEEIDAGSTCLCPHCRKNKSWVKAVAYG